MRKVLICSAAILALLAGTSTFAQDAQIPSGCAGLPRDSVEAALLGCFDLTTPPPAAPLESEPFPDPILEEVPEPSGDAALPEPELAQTSPAPDDGLVQVFAEWLERHPIGSTINPGEARLLTGADLPADLPAVPLGRSYAELDGMIVELELETGEILWLVRRAPVLAEVPPPPVEVPNAPKGDRDEERQGEDADRDQAEREAAEREQDAAEQELEEAREAAEQAQEEQERQEELARETAERERKERKEEEDQERDAGDDDEGRRGEAQAIDLPNGHMPPPGSCRVWYPDRPPGQQPPPTSCDVDVPAGAVLIRG